MNKDSKKYIALGMRNRTLLEGWGVLDSYCRKVPGTACQVEKAVDTGNGLSVRLCHEIEDRKRIRRMMEKEIKEGKYNQKFFSTIDKSYKKVLENIKNFSGLNFSELSNNELVGYFEAFYEIYVVTIHPMVLAIYASDLEDTFKKELKRALKNEKQDLEKIIRYSALLLTPTRLSTVQKEEQLLFELQQEFESKFTERSTLQFNEFCSENSIKAKLEKLSKFYGWFHMEYVGEPFTQHDYRRLLWKRIEGKRTGDFSTEENQSPNNRLLEVNRKQKIFFSKHESSEFFRELVYAMQEYMLVLDFSKADLIEGIYYARPLIEEISKRVGLNSWVDVRYLSPEEIKSFLKDNKKINNAYIKERKQNWTGWLKDGKISFYYGNDSIEINKQLIKEEQAKNEKILEGIIAFPGKVIGIANVITSAKDRNKFNLGDILVTRDTTTELTSVIKKAGAIVADYGGMLSHTAIVAREFKIPCLVSTKFATQFIQDGDKLEVDANKGIVRVLD